MKVIVPVEITKDEVYGLAEFLETEPDEILSNFIIKILKKTHEVTCSMEEAACGIKDVNPITMCRL